MPDKSLDPAQEDIFRILRVLSAEDTVSQRDLSHHLGISLGKTNYLLKALVSKGLVKFIALGKGQMPLKRFRYMLTRKGLKEKVALTCYYLKMKEKEYMELKKELEKSTGKQGSK